MSLPEINDDESKISTVDHLETKTDGVVTKLKNKPSTSQSDSITLETTQSGISKLPKFKSPNKKTVDINHSSNTSSKDANGLVSTMEGLALTPESSDDNMCKSDWLKARDSLENLLYPRTDKVDVINSKSTSNTTKEKCLIGDSPHSESVIGISKIACASSVSKVLTWDPWDKLGRKNKKENKRRKFDKSPQSKENSRSTSPQESQNRKDCTAGDELRPLTADLTNQENFETYEYQPYQPKNSRSVEFTNKVMVVYIKEDKVIGESTEPLKKELEQQIRNKEMRKGHMPDVAVGKRKVTNDWFKK